VVEEEGGGSRKEEGGRRKEEGGRKKGGGRREEGERRGEGGGNTDSSFILKSRALASSFKISTFFKNFAFFNLISSDSSGISK
jgi:hypothetical protein